MHGFEPYPVWDRRVLAQRAQVYEEYNDPLADQAKRDLALYDQHADQSLEDLFGVGSGADPH
jgi:hypothetical protein